MSNIRAETAGPSHWPDGLLQSTGVIWFLAVLIGQGAFIYFIAAYFGSRTLAGNFAAWNDKQLIDGHIPGDHVGNAMFAAHVIFAAVITFGGLIQLVPQVRQWAPGLHRWNGRIFLVVAFGMAIGGLWLTWGRGTYLSVISAIAITGDAILILLFGAMAWRRAAARRIDEHRRWALRTFMVVSGVWFLRVGLMAWLILNQGPVGMTRYLSGPADILIIFGSYLIPLAMLEIYFAAQRSERAVPKVLASVSVLAMTGVMAVGIFGTVTLLWGPYL